MKQFVFPFTAIVGQEKMKRSLILNAIDPRIGGVLIKGERGTAKSTAARALADLLPEQTVISGCRFGCDPRDPRNWCDDCQRLYAAGNPPKGSRRTPFINLPISVTEDRLVGTLDLEKALLDGKKHFEPGIFAEVNRGILYVDEVNLLDDHIVNTLLDAAAMGINHIEREGISYSHPARFIIVGTMNPEEGDLRPQLTDRFAHSIVITGVKDPAERVEVIGWRLAFEDDPERFCESFEEEQNRLRERISRARELLPSVSFDQSDLFAIAEITASYALEGHRADLVILKTARAYAAFEGRTSISDDDIVLAAELTIPHRLVTDHASSDNISPDEIGAKTAEILAAVPRNGGPGILPESPDDKKKALN